MGDTARLHALDLRHLLHPHQMSGVTKRTIFSRGMGCTLWDTDGREYLDATGGLALGQIGHGRREMAEVAAQQMEKLEYYSIFWEHSHEMAIELATKLAEITPESLEVTYFTGSGSEGNDAAYKTARYYHHQRGETNRTWILSRTTAYHGLTYGGGSATGYEPDKVGVGPQLPHFAHLTPAHPYRDWLYNGEDPTDFLVAELEETIARLGAENIAAFVGEPVMGVAGMVIPPEDYWPRIASVLRKNGILLIFDEVITGFGRLGEWFGANRYPVEPDIMVMAKGITSGYLPLGAITMTSEVAQTVQGGDGYPVGYTYSGHPVSAAAALKNIEILRGENLVPRADSMGSYISNQLLPLTELDVVGQVRSAGMAIGIELVADKVTRDVDARSAWTSRMLSWTNSASSSGRTGHTPWPFGASMPTPARPS